MIIEPRIIGVDTRDVAPQLGDVVLLRPTGEDRDPHRSRVVQVLAHYPALGQLGAWDVAVVGINKPSRTALVVWCGPPGGSWREVGGR